MPDPVDIKSVIYLPPDETARAFAARGDLATSVRWDDMWQEEHARAFTVAKVADLDLLETIRASLDRAANEGRTFEQWQQELVPELEKAGWWGRVQDPALTGTDRPISVGPRRLRTIFQTNMRVSRAAGQWARIQQRKDVAPYLRYSAVMDSRTRPMHRLWHGTILPVDDPWWETHFPPCGWNCRCTVIQVGDRELKRFGWKVSGAAPPEGPPRDFVRSGTGEVVRVPAGIDPGWAYNPGASAFAAIRQKAEETLNRIAGRDVGAALREMVYFARDRSVDFAVTIGRAGAESPDELSGFSRQLGVSEVRHILNTHGASSSDPLPLSDDEIALIPRVVAEGQRDFQKRKAGDTQVFALKEGGVFYVYVERIGRIYRRVTGRSFRKQANRPPHYRDDGGEG